MVFNKLGAYFHFDVPHTLELYNLVFDGIDSQSSWNAACLGAHETVCEFNGSVIKATTTNLSCGCSAPTDQTLNNCIMHLPTYFIKLGYKRNSKYYSPKSLLIDGCVFQHFFYSLNSLIDIPSNPSLVSITNTEFNYFSTCGSAIKNVNREVSVSSRIVYQNGKPIVTKIPED